MAFIIYHDHTLVTSPVCDNHSGKWTFTASISWDQNGTRYLRFIDSHGELFSRFENAEDAGIEAAKKWVESNGNAVAA